MSLLQPLGLHGLPASRPRVVRVSSASPSCASHAFQVSDMYALYALYALRNQVRVGARRPTPPSACTAIVSCRPLAVITCTFTSHVAQDSTVLRVVNRLIQLILGFDYLPVVQAANILLTCGTAGAHTQAIYKECNMSRDQTPPVPVFPRASAFSAGTHKVKKHLLAQANTSNSYSQQ
jgi:hypothetical protein